MDYDQFLASLQASEPPTKDPWLAALWHERRGDWELAHRIVQELPDRKAARIHAYLHRVEGDDWNARYWHDRAGTRFPAGLTPEEEWDQLARMALASEGKGILPENPA